MPGMSSDLRSKLSRLLLRESLSDVVFVVGGAPYPCHKLVLALGSRVFEAMLYGKMAEKCDVITVPDVTTQGFLTMLRYLYSDEVRLSSQSDAFETAHAAQKYMVDPLFRACESYLMQQDIRPHSVIPVLEEATFLDMKRLRARCLRYISRNTTTVMATPTGSLISATSSTLLDVLQLDLMDIRSEVEIISFLWRWGEERCRDQDLECSPANVRSVTKEFLPHVRFLSLGKRLLEQVLDECPLLEDEGEVLALLWNAAMPRSGGTRMPDGLCDVSRTRSVSNCSRVALPTEYRYDGSLTVFTIHTTTTNVTVTVTGRPQVTLVGFLLTCKPIPCYSPRHRSLDLRLQVTNETTRLKTRAEIFQKDDGDDDHHVSNESTRLKSRAGIFQKDDGDDDHHVSNESTRLKSRDGIFQKDDGDDDHHVSNESTRLKSRAEISQENDDDDEVCATMERQELLLEDYVVVAEGERVRLSVEMAAEGVRLMQCVQREFECRCGEAVVKFCFDEGDRVLFPFQELMCVVG